MTIRTMHLQDLQTVLNWAGDEGWNPGLEDAQAFFAADPQGFFVNVIDDVLVAAISVVNHDPKFAFLGLYLCQPHYRGHGYGLEVWNAAIAHAEDRSIGLDGVPDQIANYTRSGFVKYGSTIRYEGHIMGGPDPRIRLATPDDMSGLIARDRAACGMERTEFATRWFSQSATRQTSVLTERGEIMGFATFRQCALGTKIGPLHAQSKADAMALLASDPFSNAQAPYFVDVPGSDTPLANLLRTHGFKPTFDTARMFRGAVPDTAQIPFQAIATMELG